MNKFTGFLGVILLLGGCAVGNTYDYESQVFSLPVAGSGELGLAVVDARPYVVSGQKSADFVGYQRGGFGNRFDVKTTTGNPMVQDMQAALLRSLESNGYMVKPMTIAAPDPEVIAKAVSDHSLDRYLILVIREWLTDVMMSFGLTYDVLLQVLDSDATVLGEAASSGEKEKLGGGGMQRQNSIAAGRAFEAKISRLFNDPNIRRALE